MPIAPKLQTYKQDPPNAVQLELVEGCSLNCHFCGVQGIRAKRGGYKFMEERTLAGFCERLTVAKTNKWNPRLELAMHGEPSVHPQFLKMTTMLGTLKPRELIVVSNGTGFVKDPNTLIAALFSVGVTSICLDEYKGCDFVKRFREKYTGDIPVYSFIDGEKFRGEKHKGQHIVIKDDVSNLNTPYDKVNTHCGGGGRPQQVNPALHKRCAKPFRELSIRWDGNVALCCNDFRGIYKIGNLLDYLTLEELWQHPAFEAARRMLYSADRGFIPCQWCDAVSPRVGLLPDKYGKLDMPAPDQSTTDTIATATQGASYALPVLRGWEVHSKPCLPEGTVTAGLATQPVDCE